MCRKSWSRTPVRPTPTPGGTPAPTSTFWELRSRARTIEYRELLRNFEKYTRELVYYRAKVEQVVSQDGEYRRFVVRVYVTSKEFNLWGGDMAVGGSSRGQPRFLEDDMVEVVGLVMDRLFTYQAAFGKERTIPFDEMLSITC